MPWLKAFLHADLMNEHSVGFCLNQETLLGWERKQALTVSSGRRFLPSTRVAPRENKTLVPCIIQGMGVFLFF